MSYVHYSRPKAPQNGCAKPLSQTWSPSDFAASGLKLTAAQWGRRGMGQDDSDSVPAPIPAPAIPSSNPLSIFSNLFSSTDISQWGAGEWIVIAGVGLLVVKIISGITSTGKSVKRSYRKYKKRRATKSALQSQLQSL